MLKSVYSTSLKIIYKKFYLGQTIASLTDTPKSYGKKKMGGFDNG